MFKSTIIAATFVAAVSGAAFAQTQSNQSGGNQGGGGNQGQQEGLVNVQLGDVVLQDIANNLSVDVSQIPVTVQVPVAAAVNICGVDANVLAEQRKSGDVSCDATSNSEALTQIVQQQMGG